MVPQRVSKPVLETQSAGSLPHPNAAESPKEAEDQGPTPNWSPTRQQMDEHAAVAVSENIQWLELHWGELLQAHPVWEGKYLAIASRTPSKVVAVSPERDSALHEGLRSQELLEQAAQAGLPPGHLMNVMYFGISWDS